MKKLVLFSVLLLFINSSFSPELREEFTFKVEWSKLNKSLWLQPYRYENKELSSLTVRIIIESEEANTAFDFNYFSLVDDAQKTRTRPSAVHYYKGRDKKIYLKSKAVNTNYNVFEMHSMEGYDNRQIKTFKPNILGKKKKGLVASVKSIKQVTLKSKGTYYIDFPVPSDFQFGKIYYKDTPVGFAALKSE